MAGNGEKSFRGFRVASIIMALFVIVMTLLLLVFVLFPFDELFSEPYRIYNICWALLLPLPTVGVLLIWLNPALSRLAGIALILQGVLATLCACMLILAPNPWFIFGAIVYILTSFASAGLAIVYWRNVHKPQE